MTRFQLNLSKLMIVLYSLTTLFNFINSQIAEENFSKFSKFLIDETGKITFNRKISDKDPYLPKDESSYSFILAKLREVNSQNQIIRETTKLKFSKTKKEEVVFNSQNATRISFNVTFNTTEDDKFYNPKASMNLFLYFFKDDQIPKQTKDTSRIDLYIAYRLSDYEFCEVNSIMPSCISSPANENQTAIYYEGRYLEFELKFLNNTNNNYKVFTDTGIGAIDNGDFIYAIISEFGADGETKLIDSKDYKLSKEKAYLNFPKFSKNITFYTAINSYYFNNNQEDKPSEKILYKSNNSYELSVEPRGGILNLTKLDSNFLINMVSLSEFDIKGNPLKTFNNMDHFINNLVSQNFKTEEFKSDTYENINVKKSRFYLKGNPKDETIVYGDIIVFESNGRITLDGERNVEIKPGNIKLNYEIMNWPFCKYNSFSSGQNCPGENSKDKPFEGKSIDLKLSISGTKEPQILPYSQDRYSLGDFSYIFTGYINVDDKIMKIDTPKIELKDNSELITLKFPAFSKIAKMQIFIDVNKPEGPYTAIIYLIGLLSLFSAGFIVFMCISKQMKKGSSDPSLLPK